VLEIKKIGTVLGKTLPVVIKLISTGTIVLLLVAGGIFMHQTFYTILPQIPSIITEFVVALIIDYTRFCYAFQKRFAKINSTFHFNPHFALTILIPVAATYNRIIINFMDYRKFKITPKTIKVSA
jgi:hypothetical protein